VTLGLPAYAVRVDVHRRTVLLLGVGTLATGCASKAGSGAPTRSGSSSSTPRPAPSASATSSPSPSDAALPAVQRWVPSKNDRAPECKTAAVRHIERAGTSSSRAIEVIDAQYGGLLADSASVLVVTRSWRRAGDHLVSGGHTFDVRLSRRGRAWRVDTVYPSTPGARAAQLAPLARRVLANNRIDLPPAARRDVQAGSVHASVLTAMLTVAQSHRVGMSVLRSGHPLFVFGTNRPSDHPQGRAFDTWQIDGHAVVDPRTPRQLVTDYMHAVAAARSYNVGGPYLLGSAPQWFSDDTHHDHVHAGFLA
jgi:hypothetical protein